MMGSKKGLTSIRDWR